MNKMVKTNKLFKKAVHGMYKKLTNVQKQNFRHSPNPKKTATKTGKIDKFIDNKIEHVKNYHRTNKKKPNSNDTRKDKTNKKDSITEIWVNGLDTSTKIEYNDSSG